MSKKSKYYAELINQATEYVSGKLFEQKENTSNSEAGETENSQKNNDSFSCLVNRFAEDRKLDVNQVRKDSLIKKKMFLQIISDDTFIPSKDICIALSFAMGMTENEAEDFLIRSGFSLSENSIRDIVVVFLLKKKVRNVADVNRVLFELNENPLGK